MMLYTFHSYYIYTLILFNSVFHVVSLLMMSVVIYITRLKHLLKYLLKGTSVEISWIHMGVSKNNGKTPQIIHLFIGFSLIFTIHFGGFSPYFWFNIHIHPTRGLDQEDIVIRMTGCPNSCGRREFLLPATSKKQEVWCSKSLARENGATLGMVPLISRLPYDWLEENPERETREGRITTSMGRS